MAIKKFSEWCRQVTNESDEYGSAEMSMPSSLGMGGSLAGRAADKLTKINLTPDRTISLLENFFRQFATPAEQRRLVLMLKKLLRRQRELFFPGKIREILSGKDSVKLPLDMDNSMPEDSLDARDNIDTLDSLDSRDIHDKF
jgi:hypothetical protein